MSQPRKQSRETNDPRSKSNSNSRTHPEFKLKPEGELYSEDSSKYDCCSYIIHCAEHDQVLLTRQNDIRWMPFISLQPNKSWRDCGLIGFCGVLAGSNKKQFEDFLACPPMQGFRCLQVARLQLPQTFKFIKRVLFYIRLQPSSKYFNCCQEPIASHLEWHPMAEICADKIDNLWGPELVQFCQLITSAEWQPSKYKITEYALEEAFRFLPRDPPRTLEEQILNSVHISQSEVERLYQDFVEFCFPSYVMTLHSFKCYVNKKYQLEVNSHRLDMLFRTFNWTNTGWLSFPELLLGLTCMEPQSIHGEYRIRFIFRFLDTERKGHLSEQQLRAMVSEMCPANQVDANVKWLMAATDGQVTEKAFVSAIGSPYFRDSSKLCRSSKSIYAKVCQSIALKHWTHSQSLLSSNKKVLGKLLIDRRYKDTCHSCKERNYSLASHLLCINVDNKMECQRLLQVPVAERGNSGKISAQQYSMECIFKMSTAANVMIKLLREFNAVKGSVTQPKGIMANQGEAFWKILLELFNDICLLLNEESKCQRVYSPCYIIGDIHGNLEDLLSIERALWKQMPCVGPKYLFLGDYVDRGQWGLECALYLVAFKILCPNNVTLLRGNHEVRSLQARYSYKNECIYKYGRVFGLKVWELTNRIFDRLPVCALVDDAIFCAHGGIPKAAKHLEQINALPHIIHEPDQESEIIWEIIWSDPTNEQEYLDTCVMVGVIPEEEQGFVFNTKRGTAFKFNHLAANNFLRDNMLTHIIRAHEVAMPGYVFHFGNKCITIFSSSHYCGNNNKCGLLLADNQRLRVIHIDTENNDSATM